MRGRYTKSSPRASWDCWCIDAAGEPGPPRSPIRRIGAARATGWAFTEIMLALAGGTVLSAVAGMGVGHMADRGNPRLVVSCCVGIGAAGLMVVSSTPSGCSGAQTLINASAGADRWGTRDYGTLNGLFIAAVTVATAVAPARGPLLANGLGSYASMVLALACVLGVTAVHSKWS